MIGPLPCHLTYMDLRHAVLRVGDIHRLYLQWNNKTQVDPRFCEKHKVRFRFAYVVFKELAASRRLLVEHQGYIDVAGTRYGAIRMTSGRTFGSSV